MPARSDLRGVSVLVTRPRGQGDALCDHITKHGGLAVPLALMEIEAVEASPHLVSLLGSLTEFDILIFISRNAVEHGMALLAECGAVIPPRARLAAVGGASADALKRHGVPNVVYPEGQSNSEALLACDLFKHVEGSRVLIFRGQDGRELLAQTLRARGARVDYSAVYRRVEAAIDIDATVRGWLDAPRTVLVLTSEGAARLLVERLSPETRRRMFGRPVVVLSQRLRQFCLDSGWSAPIEVSIATDDIGLLQAIFSVSRRVGVTPVRE